MTDKTTLSKLFKNSKRARIYALCLGGIAIILLSGAVYKATTSQGLPDNNSMPFPPNQPMGQLMVGQIDQQLRISGTIEPATVISLLAPFEGVISETKIKIGDTVTKGQKIAVLDTSMIDESLRLAQSAFIKSKIELDKLKAWETSPDMQRAKRTLEEANNASSKADKDLAENKGLYEKGIIPRNEYETSVQEQLTRHNAVKAAEVDLEATRKQGSDEQLQMAVLEYENAKSRFDAAQNDRNQYILYAPIDGIVINPPIGASASESPKVIETGTSVQKGTTIFNIADVNSFVVAGDVDEIDINNVQNGQAVTIQSDALPGMVLNGTIIRVSSESVQGAGYGQAPKFKVRAEFKIEDEKDRSCVKLGMSARMEIQLKPAYQAILAPIDAVIDPDTQPKLRIKRDGKIITVNVVLGNTTKDGVEIKDGVLPRDEIIKNIN